MKLLRFIPSLILLIPFQETTAQTCQPGTYRTAQYGVQGDSNLVYATVQNFILDTVDLAMDVFTPVGDSSNLRPLIIWVHGGGFYAGSRVGMYGLCNQFTQRGFVTATITYRLGFYREHNSLWGQYGYPYPHDPAELHRAGYRAMQDAKAAIRYLKGNASQYGIDTSQVFIGGESAGGFVSLQTAFMNHVSERPPETDSITNVKWFNLVGQTIFNRERPDLGSIEGDQNLNGTSSKVHGLVNIYGAIEDLSTIESNDDPAVFNFHILQDPVVSCGSAKAFHQSSSLVFPFGGIKATVVHGSCRIRDRLDSLGYCPERHQTLLMNPNGTISPHSLNNVFPLVVDTVAAFLDKIICPNCVSGNQIITTQPVPISVCQGDAATIAVAASGPCLNYQWYQDGIPLPDAFQDTLWLDSALASNGGIYEVEVSTFCDVESSLQVAVQIDEPITIFSSTPDFSICEGNHAVFTFGVNVSNADYQWLKDGNPITGANTDTLVLSSVELNDSGAYSCMISNSCGADTTVPTHLTVDQATEIINQPISTTVCEGDSSFFSVNADGVSLSYQWYKNGTALLNTNSSQLTFPSTSNTEAGLYYCEVIGLCGIVSSITTDLIVETPPSISNHPSNQAANQGDTIQFAVGVSGSNLNFQWNFEGSPISGANGSILEILSISPADTGAYYCVITGSCSPADTSETAYLSLNQNTSSDNLLLNISINIYPNPARDILTIEIEDSPQRAYQLMLLDLGGKVVKMASIHKKGQIDVSDLAIGVYLLRCERNGKRIIKSVLVQ